MIKISNMVCELKLQVHLGKALPLIFDIQSSQTVNDTKTSKTLTDNNTFIITTNF